MVLQCGEADKKLQEKGIFEPSYYIITDYIKGVHYKLITYDKNVKRGAFKFNELPYRIKELVLEKCMEKDAGLFVLIPDFKTFANKNGVETSVVSKKSDYDSLVDTKKPKSQDYNDSIVIQIYSKSKHEKVGEGSGESIKPELKTSKNVLELNNKKKYPEWRKKLAAITHVDGTARIQTVTREQNTFLYDLISKFKEKTGVGVLLNTSFNVAGKPITNTVKDAMTLFRDTKLDKLIINDLYFKKCKTT